MSVAVDTSSARRALVAACLALALAGCGSASSTTTPIKNPAVAFAPVVQLSEDEPFMPVGARWFIERSLLWWGSGMGCQPEEVAAGMLFDNGREVSVEGLFSSGLGWGTAYWRRAYADSGCGPARAPTRFYSNQLTRPHDPAPERVPGLRADGGYHLDLMDEERSGPAPVGGKGNLSAQAWFGRERIEVGGEPGLRLTYWMLYGMSRPVGPTGRPVAAATHEGDWERVEVVVREGDGADSWEPISLRMRDGDGGWRRLPWTALRLARGPGAAEPTHPVLYAARGSHTLYARPGRHRRAAGDGAPAAVVDVASAPCRACRRWTTWTELANVRLDTWYGFGGAWGDIGSTEPTTGPLGPHGRTWPTNDPADQREWTNEQPWPYDRVDQ